ncbi:unnamed protein product [Leptidea sinapis]|uniref:Uncharacterized protein n=1 Tax=Leptidea sinapis TaxID=189913 RepID=A0A5E4QCD9_9NEOP|nr:unnamed protein product [Leptidea sinapis]
MLIGKHVYSYCHHSDINMKYVCVLLIIALFVGSSFQRCLNNKVKRAAEVEDTTSVGNTIDITFATEAGLEDADDDSTNESVDDTASTADAETSTSSRAGDITGITFAATDTGLGNADDDSTNEIKRAADESTSVTTGTGSGDDTTAVTESVDDTNSNDDASNCSCLEDISSAGDATDNTFATTTAGSSDANDDATASTNNANTTASSK